MYEKKKNNNKEEHGERRFASKDVCSSIKDVEMYIQLYIFLISYRPI